MGMFPSLMLVKEYGLEGDDLALAHFKLQHVAWELLVPGVVRWLKEIQADVVMYCPLSSAEAGIAGHAFGISSIALLTIAGAGSLPKALQEMLPISLEALKSVLSGYEPHVESVGRLNR